MEVRTETFNKSNWSGETTELKVRKYKDGRETFKLHGYDFTLTDPATTPSDDGDSDWDFMSRSLVGSGWKDPLFKVCKFRKDKYWTCSQYDVSREDADPVVAAAKLVFMVV
jgi:hypothetical protein